MKYLDLSNRDDTVNEESPYVVSELGQVCIASLISLVYCIKSVSYLLHAQNDKCTIFIGSSFMSN